MNGPKLSPVEGIKESSRQIRGGIILGLHEGAYEMSEDFSDPFDEETWEYNEP